MRNTSLATPHLSNTTAYYSHNDDAHRKRYIVNSARLGDKTRE